MTPNGRSLGRRGVRKVVTIPVTVLVESQGKKVRYPSRVVDVSMWGSRLKAEGLVEPGQTVQVVPSRGMMFSVRGQVIWVNKTGYPEEAELGLKFFHPIPDEYWFR